MVVLGPALAFAVALAAGPRIAVMPIAAGEAISDRSAASLTETLAAELRQQSGAEVVTSRDLGSVLSLEKQKQTLGCTTDSCMAELAGAAGAERLVSGDVAKLGESLVVQLRLLDSRKATVLAQSHRRFKKGTFDDLLDALPAMVGELLRTSPGGGVAGAAPAGPASSGATPAPAAPASASAPSPAPPAGPGQFVLHYHRDNGRYDTSRLVVWEFFVSPSQLRSAQSAHAPRARLNGREPDGRDAFGVYWRVPTDEFRSGRVNFLIRRGTGWDECGPAQDLRGNGQFWILADGPEAWVTAPGCEPSARNPGAPRKDAAEGGGAQDAPAEAAAPAPAPPAAAPRPPADRFLLHHHREDGRYDGIELVTWEKPARPVRLRERVKALASDARPRVARPDGTDAFGVYWSISTEPFPGGRVSFGVRLPGGWDECSSRRKLGDPQSWALADGREVWQSVPGCELFTDEDAAVRARRRP